MSHEHSNRGDFGQKRVPETAGLGHGPSAATPASPGMRPLIKSQPALEPTVQRRSLVSRLPKREVPEGPLEDWTNAVFRPDLYTQPVLRKSVKDGGHPNTARVSSTTSSGQPMPEDVQAKMEQSFGTDFSAVRIHEGPQAASLGALAFTQGTNIHFAPGQYDPGSHSGQELLGHELAHVVQQAEGRVGATTQTKGVDMNDDASLEREADEMGARAARGEASRESPRGPIGMPHGATAGATMQEGQTKGLQETIQDPNRTPSVGPVTQQDSKSPVSTHPRSPIQMLVKDDYPWQGVIINTRSAALRSSPGRDAANPRQGMITGLPRGTRLNVIGRQGNWLRVEVTRSGTSMTGYVSQELVDDAVAAEMENMLGQEAGWVPSPSYKSNTFETWARAATESEAPVLNSSTTLNCWEMVLLAAYRTGAINWNWIHELYVNEGMHDVLENYMTQSGIRAYIPEQTRLSRGDLVFFNRLAHVALATGSGDQIYTFWPPPDVPFKYDADGLNDPGGTLDKVKKSTIKVLSDYIVEQGNQTPKVTYGAAAW